MEPDFELVRRIVRREGKLCRFCLGSLIGMKLGAIPNVVKGAALERILELSGASSEGLCVICDDLIGDSLGELVERALKLLSSVEYNSVKAGVKLPPWLIEREDRLRAKYNPPNMVSVKLTLIKWLDLVLSAETGASVEKDPDVLVTFDLSLKDVELRISPVFVYGRYRKLERGISQSRRKCPYCGGKGCEKCNWTGKIAEGSVEGMIGEVMKEFFESEDYVLHGAGREDVDARMLGRGRPFVMELVKPKKRRADLKRIEEEVNARWKGKVEVLDLRYSNREEVRRLKEGSPEVRKLYRALVEVDGVVTDDDLKKVERVLSGAVIRQRTPKRVAWRRADLIRVRKVYEVKTRKLDERTFEMTVLCDGGLYVKELISGDDGRTTPSVAEVLGKKAFCRELDVLEVLGH